MHQVFLGLGGNIGDLQSNFRKAKDMIETRCGKIVKTSSIYKTPPVGFDSTDYFWNQVVEIETMSDPDTLLTKILEIEKVLGRIRIEGRYSSRQIDIDILYFEDLIIKLPNLKIPHPKIQDRKFVLVPLAEIAPVLVHPSLKLTTLQMLELCIDNSVIEKLKIEK